MIFEGHKLINLLPVLFLLSLFSGDAAVGHHQHQPSQDWGVAGAGDINKDGFADVIVGVPDYSNKQTGEGAAFVYYGSAQGINLIADAILESNQTFAALGKSIAGVGDINKDGFADIIAGAYLYGGDQYNEGAVFVYHGSASGLSTTPAIILEGNQIGAHLGFSVGSAGDVNSDGFDDIIAGAYLYGNEGAVFVYHGSASGLNAIPATILKGNGYDSHLGYSVAGAGDVNKDGFADVIAGAFFWSPHIWWERGEASVHHGSANGVSQTPAILLRGTEANSYLGYPVAGAGDINEDGFADVIAGGYWYSHGDLDQGMPFIYYGSVDGIRLRKNIFLPVLFKFEAK